MYSMTCTCGCEMQIFKFSSAKTACALNALRKINDNNRHFKRLFRMTDLRDRNLATIIQTVTSVLKSKVIEAWLGLTGTRSAGHPSRSQARETPDSGSVDRAFTTRGPRRSTRPKISIPMRRKAEIGLHWPKRRRHLASAARAD